MKGEVDDKTLAKMVGNVDPITLIETTCETLERHLAHNGQCKVRGNGKKSALNPKNGRAEDTKEKAAAKALVETLGDTLANRRAGLLATNWAI